jgi:FkbM family methyltransferase
VIRRLLLALHYVWSRAARRLREPDVAPLWIRSDDYIGSDVFLLGRYENSQILALRRFLGDRHRDGVLLDVGANIGNHVVALADLFARVVAVEPNPEVHAALRLNILANGLGSRVDALAVGLSDEAAELPFSIEPGNLGGSGFLDAGGDGPAAAVLQVVRGDDALAEHLGAGERLALVKIDVEGLEPRVIDGLSSTIAAHQPILAFEFNGERAGDWFSGHPVLAGYRFAEFGYRGPLRALDRVRNRSLVKLLEILVGHRRDRVVSLRSSDGRHHPVVLALPRGT